MTKRRDVWKDGWWLIDVATCVRRIGRREFTLDLVYDFADELRSLHPDNQHIFEKIRSMLQELRDLGMIEFLGDGHYRIINERRSWLVFSKKQD